MVQALDLAVEDTGAHGSQQIRDVFLEALAEISDADDGGLFAPVVYQLTDAIDITETDAGEVKDRRHRTGRGRP